MKINWFKIETEELFHLINSSLTHNTSIKLYIYLKQGYECKDCDNFYFDCTCEQYKNLYRPFIFKFICKNLSTEFLEKIIQRHEYDLFCVKGIPISNKEKESTIKLKEFIINNLYLCLK